MLAEAISITSTTADNRTSRAVCNWALTNVSWKVVSRTPHSFISGYWREIRAAIVSISACACWTVAPGCRRATVNSTWFSRISRAGSIVSGTDTSPPLMSVIAAGAMPTTV
jgi:hypothetical protein